MKYVGIIDLDGPGNKAWRKIACTTASHRAELPWDPVLRKSILPCVAGVLAPSPVP